MLNSLQVDNSLTLLPVVHGSASYAVAVRRFLLEHNFDCIAIPLPPSFRTAVLAGVEQLPTPSAAVQIASPDSHSDENGENEDGDEELKESDAVSRKASYVPIDPCQAVIAAVRFGISDRTPLEFIDQESDEFDPDASIFPDPFALRETTIERFCAAALSAIPFPSSTQRLDRLKFMANRLRELKQKYLSIVCLCDLQDWPWLRDAISARSVEDSGHTEQAYFDAGEPSLAENYAIDPRTLLFFMGELPFITGLYENARKSLDDDSSLVVDGIKEMLISTRQSYLADMGNRARKIPPLLLSQCLKYIRNQTLLDRRFTPSFYTIAKSSQQVMGDQYTIHLVEAAQNYPYDEPLPWPMLRMESKAHLPDVGLVSMTSRLPGSPTTWHSLELNRRAQKVDQRQWKMR